ncbi:hypothetical protein FG386_003443 [Cryptosporidium ryanae]|uniref:uncharacterized protein n=1 Tax=Cryptosporidium ryanae TaxID=515981 RepID=UPI00351A254A|nr:hypothetical protein FG386_003443 [Cryptosporidium ryanae]
MNNIIENINNEKVIDKSAILKNVSDNYNGQINSNIICNYSNQISKNDFQDNASEYYSINNNYQQYINKNTGVESNYLQNYGNTRDSNVDEALITQLSSNNNNDNMSLKYYMNRNDNNNSNNINCYSKLICNNCNLEVPKNDGISRNEINMCVCNNVNMLYYENLMKSNSQVNGNIMDTSTPQSIMTSLSMSSPMFSNEVNKESLSLRKDDENIVESSSGIIVNQNCELENGNDSNNINNTLCNYNRNNVLTVGNIMQNSSLLLSGYLNGTPTQSNSRKILARVRELWLSNIVDGLPRKIAAFILQRHGNQIPYDRQFWSYAYKTGRLHPAEEQVQRQLNEGVQCLNRFIQQLIKSCNIMREHMLRKQGNSVVCNTRNSRNINSTIYTSKQKITGMVNSSVGIDEMEISGYINGSLGMTNEEIVGVNNTNQRIILTENELNKRKFNDEIINNGNNVLNIQGENMINRNNIDILDNHGNVNLTYNNSNMENIHGSSDFMDNDDLEEDDDGQIAEIPLDLTDEYLAKWLDGKNALIIRKLVNGDKDVQAIDLPTSLNSDNLYRALRFGGLLVRIPPYNQKSYEYFNLLSPGRGDTRHTQLIIPDGERDIDVKKSRTSLALPDFLVEDIPLPKVCVFQIEAKLELLLLYRGCSSKRPHTKRGRTLNSAKNQQSHNSIQNNVNGINNGNNGNTRNQNLVSRLSQSQILMNRMIGSNNMVEMLINGSNSNKIMNNCENNEISNKENMIINGGSIDNISGGSINDNNINDVNISDNNINESDINDQCLSNIEDKKMKSKMIGDENYIYLANKVCQENSIIGCNNSVNIDLKDRSNSKIVSNILVNSQDKNINIHPNTSYAIIQDEEQNSFENQKDASTGNNNNGSFSTQSTVFSSNYSNISPSYYENMLGIKKKCVENTKLDYQCISEDNVTHPLTSAVCYIPQDDENGNADSQIDTDEGQLNHLFQTYSQDRDQNLSINNLTYNEMSLDSNFNGCKMNNTVSDDGKNNSVDTSENSEYGYNIDGNGNDKNKNNSYYGNKIQNEVIYNNSHLKSWNDDCSGNYDERADNNNRDQNSSRGENNNKQKYNYLNVYDHDIFEISEDTCNHVDNNIINCINSYKKNDLIMNNNQDIYKNNMSNDKDESIGINNNNNELYMQQGGANNSNNNSINGVQHPCLNWSLNIN